MRCLISYCLGLATGLLFLGAVAYVESLGRRAERDANLLGLSLQNCTRILGSPREMSEFKMSEAGDEFRGHLQNHFPLDVPGNRDVLIKEVTWSKGLFNVTVWFQRDNGGWYSVASLKWRKGVAF